MLYVLCPPWKRALVQTGAGPKESPASPALLHATVTGIPIKRETVVLALNGGSSSLKFGMFRVDPSCVAPLLVGEAEAIGERTSSFHVQDGTGRFLLRETIALPKHSDALIRLSRLLIESKTPAPQVIGHRIVHGGPKLGQPCLIDAAVLNELTSAVVFAPLHMPAALSLIRCATAHFPALPQVACFDTGFHRHMPDRARVLPLPLALRAEGVLRYGFHGLSCESIVRQLGNSLPASLLIAHLGSGASITAVKDGKSIDTSMGLTPTGGIIMGTRSGDLDPGVLIYLARQKKLDATQAELLVDQHSGLIGISGISQDLRVLHDAADENSNARLAIDMFCYCAAKQLAAMSVALGAIDAIVFTGGIGEHDARVRARICGHLNVFGIHLDEARNLKSCDLISDSVSRSQVRVLPSQEDEQIAYHAWASLE